VLQAVHAGGEQSRDRLVRERVRGDPRPRRVRPRDRVREQVIRPQRAQVRRRALGAVDPVGDDLDPAVPVRGFLRHRLGQSRDVVQFPREVPEVALGSREVMTRADEIGQVRAPVDPARVRGRARVADEQGAGVAVGDRLRLRGFDVDGARRPEPHMAVHVHEPGQHPALEHDVRGSRRPLERQQPADRPALAGLAFVVEDDDAAQVHYLSHARALPSPACGGHDAVVVPVRP